MFVLPAGSNYQLSFDEMISSSGTNMKNSVLIAVDDDLYEINSFSELWSETTNFPSNWTTRTIDLSDYAGHTITIAFKYEGTYAHNWNIDNFRIDASTPQYDITVVANNPAWGTVTGGGVYEQDENVTITAEAASGYEFKQWTKDGNVVSTNASYSFTATEDATYTAIFGEPAVTYYTISTDVNPANAGTVSGAGTYPAGYSLTLTVAANTGYAFVQWNDGNTDNPREITVNGDATYTAQFSMIDYVLTVSANPAEGGAVTGSGTFHYGDVVEITATANEGYTFLNWNDGNTAPTRYVTVIGDADYVAYFAASGVNTYTITAVPNNAEYGEVTGGGTYPEGTEIRLTATALGYARFVQWSDGSTKNPRNITVTADATYIAEFEMDELFTITVESANAEMGSVSGGGQYPAGTEIIIQANPFGGYYFDGWSDDNYDNPRTIIVNGNATYTARFSAQQAQTFTLTVSCNPTQGAVTGNGTYTAGSTITVEAIPYDGFAFSRWNDGNTDNPRSVTVNDNMTLVAFFVGTGVDENGTTILTIYPNPAKESIRIDGLEANSEVLIYNTLGMLVKSVNASSEKEIGVSDLASGVYMLRCGSQVLRFVKE